MQVINLFEFNTLLDNEYMLKRFYVDPYDVNTIFINYDTIAKELSIRGSYKLSETNTPSVYHHMLKEVLNIP